MGQNELKARFILLRFKPIRSNFGRIDLKEIKQTENEIFLFDYLLSIRKVATNATG